MNNPWEILLLDRNTVGEKDVKAAYARLLKLHRPDADPEGFQRVREAYQHALAWVKNRDADEPEDDDIFNEHAADSSMSPPLPKPSRNKPVVLSDECQMLLSDLKKMLPNKFWTGGQRKLFRRISLAFDAMHLPATQRAAEWLKLYDFDEERIIRHIPVEILVRQIQLGEEQLVRSMIEHFVRGQKMSLASKVAAALEVAAHMLSYDMTWLSDLAHAEMSRFSKLADALEAAACTLPHDSAPLLMDFATSIALEIPAAAESLANALFLILHADERKVLIDQLEQRILVGRSLQKLGGSQRVFWLERLRQPQSPLDGSTWKMRRLMKKVVRRVPDDWAGWSVLAAQMTPIFWAKTNKWIKWEGIIRRLPVMLRMARPLYWPRYALAVVVLIVFAVISDKQERARPRTLQYDRSISPEMLQAFQRLQQIGAREKADAFLLVRNGRSLAEDMELAPPLVVGLGYELQMIPESAAQRAARLRRLMLNLRSPPAVPAKRP